MCTLDTITTDDGTAATAFALTDDGHYWRQSDASEVTYGTFPTQLASFAGSAYSTPVAITNFICADSSNRLYWVGANDNVYRTTTTGADTALFNIVTDPPDGWANVSAGAFCNDDGLIYLLADLSTTYRLYTLDPSSLAITEIADGFGLFLVGSSTILFAEDGEMWINSLESGQFRWQRIDRSDGSVLATSDTNVPAVAVPGCTTGIETLDGYIDNDGDVTTGCLTANGIGAASSPDGLERLYLDLTSSVVTYSELNCDVTPPATRAPFLGIEV